MPKSQVKSRAILRIALLCMSVLFISLALTSCRQNINTLRLAIYQPNIKADIKNGKAESTYIYSQNETRPKQNRKSFTRDIKSQIDLNHVKEETSIGVVGDIMFHNTQLFRAYDASSESFDFSNIFKYMEPYLKRNDLTFANLETTLYGPYGSEVSENLDNYHGYSAYPKFNSPDSILEPILNAGFDFLSTANNHCLDTGYDGMIRTLNQLDSVGIKHTGTFLSLEQRKPYELIEAKGISFAVVNYTYATNGLYLSKEQMKLVNTLEVYQDQLLENLYADVEAAKNSEADFVICMLHYGNEYWQIEDSRFQKPVTLEVIKRGADIVFGGHPHTIEPIDIIYQVDDVVYEEPKIIIYSLGNFLASQRNISDFDAPTDLGLMFNVYFETLDQQNPRITGIGLLPTYTIWQKEVIATMPVTDDLTLLQDNNLSLDDYKYSTWDKSRIAEAKNYVVHHLMQYIYPKDIVSDVYNDQGIYRFDIINN